MNQYLFTKKNKCNYLYTIIMVECDFCHESFVKGTGHLCWCSECSKPHPMCNNCYEVGKEDGDVVDVNIPRKSISNPEKYA